MNTFLQVIFFSTRMIKILSLFTFTLFNLPGIAQELDVSIRSEPPIRGIYKTFEEFRFNRPSVTDSFNIEYTIRSTKNWEGVLSYYPRYHKNNKRVKKVWGFNDGCQAFIFHQLEFFPIKIDENEISFNAYGMIGNTGVGTSGALRSVDGGAMDAMGAMGAVGGAVYGAVALSKAKKQAIKYVINSETGIIYDSKYLLGTAKVIFYRRKKKELDRPFNMTINDSIFNSFIPNSYLEVSFPISKSSINICSDDQSIECLDLIIETKETKYIECSISINDELPKAVVVETEVGEFYSRASRYQQEKRMNKANGKKK